MPPGPELGILLPRSDDVAGLGDEELTGVVRAWRRMGSWAAAMEHAAVAELVRRRIAEAGACGAPAKEVPRYAAAEVAAALTLTSRSADGLMARAMSLAALPATSAALAAGEIDVPKALAIINGVSCLSWDLVRAVEAQVVPGAGGQTTGELRRAVAAAVIAADPAAADRRVAEATKSARVERWAEPCGTVGIAGRDLPPADALAADNRVNALAAALKADGAPGGMDLLRAQVFLGLLLGNPVAAPAAGTAAAADTAAEHKATAEQTRLAGHKLAEQSPAAEEDRTAEEDPAAEEDRTGEHGCAPSAGPAADDGGFAADDSARERDFAVPQRVAAGPGQLAVSSPPPGGGWAGGAVNLTVPLRSLLGESGQPAEIAGFGPISRSVTHEILTAARHSTAVKWCVTVTDADGRATGHGCATRTSGDPAEPGGWGFTLTVRALEAGDCGHARQSAAYKPPPLLRHLIHTRNKTCTAPGCGRPAWKCDLDHSIPYDAGGLTCECNLAPLCRFHHKVKQAQGWTLKQRSPGVLEWITPSGWRYTIIPSRHPI